MRSWSLRLLILACALALLQVTADVHSQAANVSGVSYIDCRGKPRFKVGDWVTYRFRSKSDAGDSVRYDMTILISGEEVFWGEDCFWVETQITHPGMAPGVSDAKLMSYAMFGDTLWELRLLVYQRKYTGLADDGSIHQELIHRSL